MLNLRESIKGLHLNQHQIEINMSGQLQVLKNKIKYSNIHNLIVEYTTIDGALCIEYAKGIIIQNQINYSYIYQGIIKTFKTKFPVFIDQSINLQNSVKSQNIV